MGNPSPEGEGESVCGAIGFPVLRLRTRPWNFSDTLSEIRRSFCTTWLPDSPRCRWKTS